MENSGVRDMSNYHVRKAADSDFENILSVYAYARQFMAEHNNPNQWGTTKPSPEELCGDIRSGNLYVVEKSGTICGVFAFFLGEDPTYAEIFDGSWHFCMDYGTIHRVAGCGSRGILHACVSYCEQITPYLRIDTHHDNYVMQRAVLKEGFRRCGIIYIADGTPRIAYDRLI